MGPEGNEGRKKPDEKSGFPETQGRGHRAFIADMDTVLRFSW